MYRLAFHFGLLVLFTALFSVVYIDVVDAATTCNATQVAGIQGCLKFLNTSDVNSTANIAVNQIELVAGLNRTYSIDRLTCLAKSLNYAQYTTAIFNATTEAANKTAYIGGLQGAQKNVSICLNSIFLMCSNDTVRNCVLPAATATAFQKCCPGAPPKK